MTKITDFLLAVCVGLVAAAVVLGAVWLPVFGVVLFFLPAPFILLSLRKGYWTGAIGLLTLCVVYTALSGPMAGGAILVLAGFAALGIPAVLRQKRSYREYLAFSAGLVLASVLAIMGLYALVTGQSLFSALIAQVEQYLNENQDMLGSVLAMYKQWGLADPELSIAVFIRQMVAGVRDFAPFVPALLITSSAIIGVLNLMIPYRLAARKGVSLHEIPPFGRWRMPRGSVLGFLVLGGLSLLLTLINGATGQTVLYTVSSLFAFLFSIQGLSLAEYLMENGRISVVLRVILCLLLYVFLSPLLLFAGVFDQLLHIREQMDHMKDR